MATVVARAGGYYSSFRHKGRHIQRFLSKDKREAWLKLGVMVQQVRGEPGAVDRYPWDSLKDRLLVRNERRKALNGLKRDKIALTLLERFFAGEYGHPLRFVADVTLTVLGQFMARRRAEGLTPATVKREAGAIKAAMRWAEVQDPPLRPVADWRKVAIPKVGKRRPPHHSRQDLKRLLKSLPAGRWRLIGWIGARAGLRRGELLHLRPQDIQFERRAVVVVGKECRMCRECRDNGGRWQPKDVDEREVPMPQDLLDFLIKAVPPLRKQAWLLADGRGQRPSLEEMSTYFARLTRKAGLKGGLQKLRATWLTHALDDVPSKIVKEWAGHASLITTEQYVSPGAQDQVWAEKMRPLD